MTDRQLFSYKFQPEGRLHNKDIVSNGQQKNSYFITWDYYVLAHDGLLGNFSRVILIVFVAFSSFLQKQHSSANHWDWRKNSLIYLLEMDGIWYIDTCVLSSIHISHLLNRKKQIKIVWILKMDVTSELYYSMHKVFLIFFGSLD